MSSVTYLFMLPTHLACCLIIVQFLFHSSSVQITPFICRSAKHIYDYSKEDHIGLNQCYISTCDLTAYYNTTDVNNAWTILKQLITTRMDLFIPKVKLRSAQYPKWFAPKIRHHVKCLCTLHIRLHHYFTFTSLQHLIHLHRNITQEISNARKTMRKSYMHNLRTLKFFTISEVLPNLDPFPHS